MNKFFPNIETAIIVVFILCVMLWGASRCKRQKEDLTNRAVTESPANTAVDTLPSPAAARPKPKTTLSPLDPAMTTTTPTPQYSQTPPSNPGQALPQPVPQQNIPTPNSLPAGAPSATTTKSPRNTPSVTTPETTTNVEQTGSALYVLRSGLNVRAKASVKSKSLGKLKLNDQVYFMDEVSQTAETVRLENGTEITKPWFKIKTKKGTIGWVHGSGVDFYKRKPQDVF
jgi:Bacterial SH3 domain